MVAPRVVDLGLERKLLDLDFRDTEGLVAAYLLPEPEGWALIETGPTSCHGALLRAVAAAGVEARDVRDILVTHIHLDHAGGLGAVAEAFPNARLYAHELGVGHLVDPSRLIASARRVYGEASDQLWGTVVPAPAARLQALRGGETLALRRGELQVLATPGHAKHHLAFFDSELRAVFAGDGAGVRLERSPHLRPAVPPPDLDLGQLFASLELMRRAEPRFVLLSHFGPTPNGASDLERYRAVVERWRDIALAAARERPDAGFIAARLQVFDAAERGGELGDRASMVSGYDVAAQGFLRYFQTHGELVGAPS
ncbi:MAG TPA: MBL fold metallo-hydrolase [Thermoplasmata archaeon]|nr:MBL fold metallo-hydrolase [Thermoplasmata archaeon]